MKVELLYFDGCPNWTDAEARLQEALLALGRVDVEVQCRRVETPEDAERLNFPGSPTILVDGRDPFADTAAPPGLTCRLYPTPDEPSGAPTVEQPREALGG